MSITLRTRALADQRTAHLGQPDGRHGVAHPTRTPHLGRGERPRKGPCGGFYGGRGRCVRPPSQWLVPRWLRRRHRCIHRLRSASRGVAKATSPDRSAAPHFVPRQQTHCSGSAKHGLVVRDVGRRFFADPLFTPGPIVALSRVAADAHDGFVSDCLRGPAARTLRPAPKPWPGCPASVPDPRLATNPTKAPGRRGPHPVRFPWSAPASAPADWRPRAARIRWSPARSAAAAGSPGPLLLLVVRNRDLRGRGFAGAIGTGQMRANPAWDTSPRP